LKRKDDYYDQNGMLCCGICHTPKELDINLLSSKRRVRVMCDCRRKMREDIENDYTKQENIAKIQRLKSRCIHDNLLLNCKFENDDGSLKQLASARRYVDTWEKRKAENDGLILWGDVGTGKTFYAACIANALIEKGVLVLMTNFAKVLNQLGDIRFAERNVFISEMMKYHLLIIDDFGIERNTDYALEQIYHIVDERYKTQLPLIVTTNLSIKKLKEPADTAHKRTYDRLLSMCIPVKFSGPSYRKSESERKFKAGKELFEE